MYTKLSPRIDQLHVEKVPCVFASKKHGRKHNVYLALDANGNLLHASSDCSRKHGKEAILGMEAKDSCYAFVEFIEKVVINTTKFLTFSEVQKTIDDFSSVFGNSDSLIYKIIVTARDRARARWLNHQQFNSPLQCNNDRDTLLTNIVQSVAGHTLVSSGFKDNQIILFNRNYEIGRRYPSDNWTINTAFTQQGNLYISFDTSSFQLYQDPNPHRLVSDIPPFLQSKVGCDICAMTLEKKDKHMDSERHRKCLEDSIKRALRATGKVGLKKYHRNNFQAFMTDVTATSFSNRVSYYIETRPNPFRVYSYSNYSEPLGLNTRFISFYQTFPHLAVQQIVDQYSMPELFARLAAEHWFKALT